MSQKFINIVTKKEFNTKDELCKSLLKTSIAGGGYWRNDKFFCELVEEYALDDIEDWVSREEWIETDEYGLASYVVYIQDSYEIEWVISYDYFDARDIHGDWKMTPIIPTVFTIEEVQYFDLLPFALRKMGKTHKEFEKEIMEELSQLASRYKKNPNLIKKMKVKELKENLTLFQQDVTGRKADLLKRLTTYLGIILN